MEGKKKYFEELNIFRALIIVWVIIGHSFDSGTDFLGMLHSYAYTFHMAAFFMLSGILFAGKCKSAKSIKDKAVLIKNRALRLLTPYLFFTCVSYLLKIFFDEYANNSLPSINELLISILTGCHNPNGGLWFLHNLFVFSAVAVLISFIPSAVSTIVILAANIACFLLNGSTFNILYFALYFALGLAVADRYDNVSKFFEVRYREKSSCIRLAVIDITMLAASVALFIADIILSLYTNLIFKIFYTLFNIITWYLIACVITRLGIAKKPLGNIGSYSMDIYMIGYYVQIALRVILKSMLGTPYIVYSLCMMIFGLILPIPISKYIVRKVRLFRILCLGDYSKKQKCDDTVVNNQEK